MKIFAVAFLIGFLASGISWAEEGSPSTFEFKGSALTDIRSDEGRLNIGEGITLKLKVRLPKDWKINTMVNNGHWFSDGFNAFYDSGKVDRNADAENIIKELSIRKLYVSKYFIGEKVKFGVHFGAMGPEKSYASITSMHRNGWIDGVRVNAESDMGTVSLTAGSIGDLDKTNFYERKADFDYYEILVGRELFEKFVMDFSAESYLEKIYLRAATQYELNYATNRALTLMGESLYNTDNSSNKFSVGFKTDLLNLIMGSKSGISLHVRHNHLSDDMGVRGSFDLTPGFTTSIGDFATVGVYGAFDEKRHFTWFLQYRENYDIANTRYEVGFKINF